MTLSSFLSRFGYLMFFSGCLLISLSLTAQPYTFSQRLQEAEKDIYAIGEPVELPAYRIGKASDSPYLFQNWLPGNIHLASGFVHEDLELKLDLYNDMILYQGPKGLVALHKDYIRSFTLFQNDISFNFIKAELEPESPAFCELVYEGETRLLKLYQKVLVKTREVQGEEYPEAFASKNEYFIEISEGVFVKLKLNKAAILKHLSPRDEAVKEFVRAHELNLREEEDVIRLLRFYDAL